MEGRWRHQLEQMTRGQSTCEDWFAARRGRVTGSMCQQFLKLHQQGRLGECISRLTAPKPIYIGKPTDALLWGKVNEESALICYRHAFLVEGSYKWKECGFKIALDGVNGATPDGMWFGREGMVLVEVKCPFSIRHKDPNTHPPYYLHPLTKHLDKTHDYYYQCQSELYAWPEAVRVDFVVWTPLGTHVQPIFRDQEIQKRFANLARDIRRARRDVNYDTPFVEDT